MNKPQVMPKYFVNGFFVLGIVGAVSFRILIVLGKVAPDLVRPVWYLGVVSYVFFFVYRYYISQKRRRAITNFNLVEKLESGQKLSKIETEVNIYLLNSITRSKENLNYLIIFILSIVMIFFDIILNF